MAARRQVTNKLRDAYRKGSRADKGRILSEVVSATGLARSSARRILAGPVPLGKGAGVDHRALKPRKYSDGARLVLVHVWALMGYPCGKYFVVMAPMWIPLLAAAGDLDQSWATQTAVEEVAQMSAATVDRYLKGARDAMRLKGITSTKPSPLLRNSIAIRRAGDELEDAPGMIEADTVAHCGPTLKGEFIRTLTMTDMSTGWTENRSIRNNATTWITDAVSVLRDAFPFPLTGFDSDNGSEFINHAFAQWLQVRDIAFTRSRPYKKNDQAGICQGG